MKKFTLTCLLAAGLSTVAFSQGVFIDLTGNPWLPSWIRPGLLYRDGVPLGTNYGPTVNVTLWGGVDGHSVTNKLVSLYGASACWVLEPGAAVDATGNEYTVPGLAPNATGYFVAQWWLGSATSFEQAVSWYTETASSGVFANPTGGGGSPLSVPLGLFRMPDLEFSHPIPEPSAIGLGGLGLAALFLFRRRR